MKNKIKKNEVKPWNLAAEFRSDPTIKGTLLFNFLSQEEQKAIAEGGGYHPIWPIIEPQRWKASGR